MAKAAENQRNRPGPRLTSAETGAVADWPSLGRQFWPGIVAAVFFARFFVPAEAAAQGDSLWIACLWFLLGLAWAISVAFRKSACFRFDWMDAAIGVWIGGQVVSALVVILTVGEKRMAANMAWEWLAIGVSWIILRHGITVGEQRQALLRAMIVTGVILASYGLYQHYVEHSQLVAEYGPLFDKLRTATGVEAENVKRKLAQNSVPTEGPAAILFEKRLRDSREPLGLFALANTFGGCLAVCLLLALGDLLMVWRRKAGLKPLAILFVAVALIGWCLLLTKSRTAWIGSACGLVVLLLTQGRWGTSVRRILIPATLVLMAAVSAATLLFLFGGLDRQVLSEAPKSLAYRFQYWEASSQLVADHPWLGVGPGNFRQHYLQYKLPQASEEIADPHNLFFDIAAGGGIISLMGMLAFLLAAAFRALKNIPERTTQLSDTTPQTSPPSGLTNSRDQSAQFAFWMAGAGGPVAFIGLLVCWGQWEDRLLILSVLWFPAAWLFLAFRRPTIDSAAPSQSFSYGAFAAAVALEVHLLGAGGISMPAVTQTLLMLVAFALVKSPNLGAEFAVNHASGTRWRGITLAVACAGMLMGIAVTALGPVIRCRSLLERGTAAGWSGEPGGRETAIQDFQAAAEADPWSPDPWQHQFEWSGADRFRSNDSFDLAVRQLQEVMRRDPINFWAPRTLGNLWLNRWRVTQLPEDVGPAVIWLDRAHQLYPTNSLIMAELAIALAGNQELSKAATMAQAALHQDDIYHEQGHVDRYLEEANRDQLKGLAGIVPMESRSEK